MERITTADAARQLGLPAEQEQRPQGARWRVLWDDSGLTHDSVSAEDAPQCAQESARR